MKVLIIASGNKNGKPGAVVQNQADTLKSSGIQIEFFLIKGKGLIGYLNNVYPLFKYLKKTEADVIHSHYSLSALAASFALLFSSNRPHVVSLMGSDAKIRGFIKALVKFWHKHFWKKTIVKSLQMQEDTGLKDALVIPNGVDLNKIEAIENELQNNFAKDDSKENTILFAADPSRESKNYPLAKSAMEKVFAKLNVIYNKSHEEILKAILDADVVLLTSRWEGSPNIIKEAMACNRPVVSTNVGDVGWLFGNEPGHFLTTFEAADVADKIQQALNFARQHSRTNGRKRILELGLDAQSVAKRLVEVYEEAVLERGRK